MIALWMVYAALVGMIALAVAAGGERIARMYRVPARAVWAAAMVATLLVPAWLLVQGNAPAVENAASDRSPAVGAISHLPAAASAEPVGLRVSPAALEEPAVAARRQLPSGQARGSAATLWLTAVLASDLTQRLLLLGWGAAVLAMLGLAGSATLRLRRARREWTGAELHGVQVRLSARTGPAVAGVLRPEIVVPETMLRWEESAQQLAIEHEQEHRRARDPLLLAFGFGIVALCPWNAVLWWQLRRLRAAVEIDCDARVLARRPGVHRYGTLLLEVSRFPQPAGAGIVAFAEPGSLLERRIRTMTERPPARRFVMALATALLCGTGVAAASAVPVPEQPRIAAERRAAPPPQTKLPPVVASPAHGALASPRAVAAAEPSQLPPGIAILAPAAAAPSALQADTVLPRLLNAAEVAATLRAQYPQVLRDAGMGGQVLVALTVDPMGLVTAAEPVHAADQRLVGPALAAARSARFAPATFDGEPITAAVRLPLHFIPPRPAGTDLPVVSTEGTRTIRVTPVGLTPVAPAPAAVTRQHAEAQRRHTEVAFISEDTRRRSEEITRRTREAWAAVQRQQAEVQRQHAVVQRRSMEVQRQQAEVQRRQAEVQRRHMETTLHTEEMRRRGEEFTRRTREALSRFGLEVALGDPAVYVWFVADAAGNILRAGMNAMPTAGQAWSTTDVQRQIRSHFPVLDIEHTYLYAGLRLEPEGQRVNVAWITTAHPDSLPSGSPTR